MDLEGSDRDQPPSGPTIPLSRQIQSCCQVIETTLNASAWPALSESGTPTIFANLMRRTVDRQHSRRGTVRNCCGDSIKDIAIAKAQAKRPLKC